MDKKTQATSPASRSREVRSPLQRLTSPMARLARRPVDPDAVAPSDLLQYPGELPPVDTDAVLVSAAASPL